MANKLPLRIAQVRQKTLAILDDCITEQSDSTAHSLLRTLGIRVSHSGAKTLLVLDGSNK
jgi:hypothetical protein